MLAAALLALGVLQAQAESDGPPPERVTFDSADGKTTLVGYLYRPRDTAAPVPAVVMMHGRAGAYSEAAGGVYDASTLSKRHQAWGRAWAEAGYVALLVDGFGPRGYPAGFPRFSYAHRPEELNEVTVRPLDAYGALAYLRTLPAVRQNRVGLQGWSNGASATIAAMSADAPSWGERTPVSGFRAALAFYPGCGLKGTFDAKPFHPYAPVLVLQGTGDEEVSYRRCVTLVERSREGGGDVAITLYPGATHSFDAPTEMRQNIQANAEARRDALMRAHDFFVRYLEAASD
jgi:carboxymethylenebutenolidase